MSAMNSSVSPEIVHIGMIGCGGRLRAVVNNILCADHEKRLRVVAAYDPDPLALDACAAAFGSDCKKVLSEEELARDPAIDWVFIGSWNCHHARQAILALNAGKNVFCEKPLAITLEDCLAIQDAVQKSGKVFAFGLVLRYSPLYQKIMEVIQSGVIGQIISFEFNETLAFNHGGYIFGNWRRYRENAGTHILEKCCHDIDLANWIIGSLPVNIASFGGRNFFIPENARHMERIGPKKKEPLPADSSRGGAAIRHMDPTGAIDKTQAAYCSWVDPHRCNPFDGKGDIFDNQVAILQYANGIRGSFHTNCNAGLTERRFYICGTEGALRAEMYTGALEIQRIGWDTQIEKIETPVSDSHGGGDEVMAKGMVETILRGMPPLASVEEGIKSAIVAFGIDQAADQGCVVDLHSMWQQAGIVINHPQMQC